MKAHLLEDEPIKTNRFDGGLRLPSHKSMSTQRPLAAVAAPDTVVVPVHQHTGEIGDIRVAAGERVLKGQALATPRLPISAGVHSPVSGTVREIGQHAVPHPSGLPATCIIIENDHRDEWIERKPVGDAFLGMSPHDLRTLIREAGIVGLGGATFPTAVKQTEVDIQTLILNGVECEPYISCDDMLMREYAGEIIAGAEIIGHIIKARECIIAIEDNKPEAIAAMRAVAEADETGYFRVQPVPTIYPSGGEKQIIKVITGKEVPMRGLPADIDVLCQNVGTARAIYRAIYHDEPLISRLVTVTGQGVNEPRNLEVPIGIAIRDCIEQAGGYHEDARELIIGGPMMGFTVRSDEMPVVKSTNCLLVAAEGEIHPASQVQHSPCIRCGLCADVCPARLLPQQLYWYASSQNFDRLVEHDLFDCIECGCCAYVCPSNIPLVQYYRFAKSEIWEQDAQRKKADIARQRHEAREARIEKQKQERKERMRKKRETLKNKPVKSPATDAKKAAIDAALARVKAKKQEQPVKPRNVDNLSNEQKALVAAVDKRREEANHPDAGSGKTDGGES